MILSSRELILIGGRLKRALRLQTTALGMLEPDHLGSTTFVTKANGDEWEHMEYSPYGETWIDEGSDRSIIGYRFTSKELDTETGLYYFGARYMDPTTSRWMSADPDFGKYLPEMPSDDSSRKLNKNLPGMGGVFNFINLA